MEGKTPDQIADGIQAAYARGPAPTAGHGLVRLHMMVFAPYYDYAMLGGNEVGLVPVVIDDARTPFTVILIPVDGKLAIKAQQK